MAGGIFGIPFSNIPGTTDWFLNLIQGADQAVTGGVGTDAVNNVTTPMPADMDIGQGAYNFSQRMFPLDLGSGSSFNGHYIVININMQTTSNMAKVGYGGDTGKVSQYYTIGSDAGDQLSKTDALRFNIDNNFFGTDEQRVGGLTQNISGRPRFTRRIVESIALYMPNSELTFTDAHDFANISLTKFAGSLLTGAASTIAAFGGGFIGGMRGAEIGAGVGNLLSSTGEIIGATSQIVGTPINPKVEVLFANTFQREFAFEFIFSPSSEEESIAIQNIIRTLRFHAAPEQRSGGLAGVGSYFWVPPSEFDITFYNRGQENIAIPRINTCVLKQIDVSYSPTGAYSTFRNGHPTQIRMMLRFTETEVAHKLRILQGF